MPFGESCVKLRFSSFLLRFLARFNHKSGKECGKWMPQSFMPLVLPKRFAAAITSKLLAFLHLRLQARIFYATRICYSVQSQMDLQTTSYVTESSQECMPANQIPKIIR